MRVIWEYNPKVNFTLNFTCIIQHFVVDDGEASIINLYFMQFLFTLSSSPVASVWRHLQMRDSDSSLFIVRGLNNM